LPEKNNIIKINFELSLVIMRIKRFWNQINNIFQEGFNSIRKTKKTKGFSDESVLIHHEPLNCKEHENNSFHEWTFSDSKTQILEWVLSEYQRYQDNEEGDTNITFMTIPSVNGIVIQYNPELWSESDFKNLFFYLKNIFKTEGYFVQVSDSKKIKRNKNIEETLRHYLKPLRKLDFESGSKMEQKYGNLMLSLILQNGQIQSLKICATHYNDFLYDLPYSFDQFIRLICRDDV